MNHRIIQDLFERSVATGGGRPAVIEADLCLSYTELNRRANRLAWVVKDAGVSPNGIVAVAQGAGAGLIVSELASLKAGCAFMPISLQTPQARLAIVLQRARPQALVAPLEDADLIAGLLAASDNPQLTTVLVDRSGAFFTLGGDGVLQQVLPAREDNPPSLAEPDSGAYVVFTSGSTGEPKIILGLQKSLSHFLHWEKGEFDLGPELRTLSLAPPTFDVSLRDIYLPLLCGGAVCIPDPATRQNIPALVRFVGQQQVNLIHCVPSLFREITSHLQQHDPEAFQGVDYLLLAGEPLYGADVLRFRQATTGKTRLVNLYGPSETTLAKMFFRIDGESLAPGQIVPVGSPISNTAVLILKGNRLCKAGEPGEIHIKTPFRSRGYIGNDQLNAQVFIQNPLSDTPDILYKTGDMGRYRPDHKVDFIGRIDRQVKLRGNRVELPEVEQAVAALDKIHQVFVRANLKDGLVDGLTCYYTAQEKISREELVVGLRKSLPDYMIPTFFVQL
ncbi:MAG: hypothetical protein C0614_04725, partial [Desulfuromonas sp.]